MIRICALFFALCLLALPVRVWAEVTVFAAASLKNALEDASVGQQVVFSFAGSGTIARQIAAGAPADLVILANSEWMDWLEAKGAVLPGSRRDLVSNRLVVVGPIGTAPLGAPIRSDLFARLGPDRLAIGEPASVPAGIYGRAWLQKIGAWSRLKDQLAPTENVRTALALVARGEAPLGLVYITDAAAEPRVQIVYTIPAYEHPTIAYPAAAVTTSGLALLEYLQSPAALKKMTAHGFLPIGTQE